MIGGNVIKRLKARFSDNVNVSFFEKNGELFVQYFDTVMILDPQWGYEQTASEVMELIRDFHMEELMVGRK